MTHTPRGWLLPIVATGLALVTAGSARCQQADTKPLRLQGLVPGGARSSVTESWGPLNFAVTNFDGTARDARVTVFYPERPEEQYGRDIWVPPHSTLSSWLLAGPAPRQQAELGREIQFLLYDRVPGQEHLQLPPGDERIRGRAIFYQRRQPTTAIWLDDVEESDEDIAPDSHAAEALVLARTFRLAANQSEKVSIVSDRFLPPMPAAFDGIDHFTVASNRLGDDPVGRRALRQWVEQGGRLWVLLDLVDPRTVAPFLGEDFDVQVVDRISLTEVALHRAVDSAATPETRPFDRPVDFVRVTLSGAHKVLHLHDGWPASFTRQLGRGKVLFTTLGARGWHRPRRDKGDSRSPFEHFPNMPVPEIPLEELAYELQPPPESGGFRVDDLRPLLMQEIGYSIISRGKAGLILGGFVVALLALALVLRTSRRPELAGWLGLAAAVVAAALFLGLGRASRSAVPPSAAVAELVDAVPGTGEAASQGLFALYRPSSGPTALASTGGGLLELDMAALEGKTRRWLLTDTDAWHWEQLELPAGVRSGPFHTAASVGHLSATARFGPEGVDGRLDCGPFREPGDALIITAAREPIAIRIGPGNAFAARGTEVLAADQYIAGTVLSDRQQAHQEVYRKLFAKLPTHWEGRPLVLAWAEPAELPFAAEAGVRTVGTALLAIPLAFERPAVGTRVTIPSAFLQSWRVFEGRPRPPTMDSSLATDQELRFQVPSSVLPLKVERATFVVKMRAPSRRVTVTGHAGNERIMLNQVESPLDPIRVEITDARLLQLDAQGGLHVSLNIGEEQRAPASPVKAERPAKGTSGTMRQFDTVWKIESISMEIVGQTAEK
jgi:hypothetical protein